MNQADQEGERNPYYKCVSVHQSYCGKWRATRREHELLGLLRHCVNGLFIPNNTCLIVFTYSTQSLSVLILTMNLLDQTSNEEKEKESNLAQDYSLESVSQLTLMERSSPPIATITSIGGRLEPSLWFSIVALIAFYGQKNIVMATLSSRYANYYE